MKFDYKEHLKSAVLTFGAEFMVYFVPAILGTTDFTKSAVLAIVITALRGGLKEVWETVAVYLVKMKNENKNQTIEETIKDIDSSSTTSNQSSEEV